MKKILTEWKKFIKESTEDAERQRGIDLGMQSLKKKMPQHITLHREGIFDKIAQHIGKGRTFKVFGLKVSREDNIRNPDSGLGNAMKLLLSPVFRDSETPGGLPPETNALMMKGPKGEWTKVDNAVLGAFHESDQIKQLQKDIIEGILFAERLHNKDISDEYLPQLLKLAKSGGKNFAQAYEVFSSLSPEDLQKKSMMSKVKGFFKGKNK